LTSNSAWKKNRRKRPPVKPPGTSPGTLVADPNAQKPVMAVIAYGPTGLVEKKVTSPSEVCALLKQYPVVWLNVDGLGDIDVIREIGEAFELHRLALEDVTDVQKRAKVDRFGDTQYIVAVMVGIVEGALDTEQLSLFVGPNFVITFQEREGDGFDRVRERVRGGKGLIRTGGPGYLTYALLDATIDEYFPVLEHYGERLEMLEDALVEKPDASRLPEVHSIRRDLLALRRAVWPMREALNTLIREGHEVFTPETRPYLNDCYEHTVQIMDLVENYRETASGMMDIYLSSMSNRMNEIMKVLTIISTIFIPLTFIAGVYGMNFDRSASPLSMPELGWKYGYVACIGTMIATTVFMLLFFRRRGWLGPQNRHR
jgi:magnesium transporter